MSNLYCLDRSSNIILFIFLFPSIGLRTLSLTNSIPSWPLSSISVKPIILENASPPKYDLLFSLIK